MSKIKLTKPLVSLYLCDSCIEKIKAENLREDYPQDRPEGVESKTLCRACQKEHICEMSCPMPVCNHYEKDVKK